MSIVIRKAHNRDGWTPVPNALVEDQRLSWRSKGVLVYLLSRPDGWVTDSERIAAEGKEGRDAVRTALRELEDAGYVHRRKMQGQRGTWSTERYVFDHPVSDLENALNPTVDNSVETWGQPTPENPPPEPEKPTPENPALLTKLITMNKEPSQRNPTSPSLATLPPNEDAASGDAAPPGSLALAEEAIASLPEADLDAFAFAALLQPGLPMFALRAHLVATLKRPVSFPEAAEHLRAALLADPHAEPIALADVVAFALLRETQPLPNRDGAAVSETSPPPASASPSELPLANSGSAGGALTPRVPISERPSRQSA